MNFDPDISLFRLDAIKNRTKPARAGIVLARPVSLTVFCWIVALCGLATATFMYLGSYTSRITASGIVASDIAINRIESPISGIITKQFVEEGQAVKMGDPLYEVSSNGRNQNASSIQDKISRSIKSRLLSYEEESHNLAILHHRQQAETQIKLTKLRERRKSLVEQISLQETHVSYAQESVERFMDLEKKHFISREQSQGKIAEKIEIIQKLQSLRDELNDTDRDLSLSIFDESSLPLRQASEKSKLDREFSLAEQDFQESEAKRATMIYAPIAGTITAVSFSAGQTCSAASVLAQILPLKYRPQANLYIPTSAAGFISVGNPVSLRFRSFPYQRYGSIKGTVTSVSKSILTASDLAQINFPGGATPGEGMYKVIISLNRGTDTIPTTALRVGMAIDADIFQEKRSLYRWILAPVGSMSESLQ